MSLATPKIRVERRRCAPATYPCPTCGQPGRRKQEHTRPAQCIAYGEILLWEVTTAEYRATCACCKTFRSQVEGLPPRAYYTDRVRSAVLDRLIEDRLSVEALRRSMARDFYLDLSDGFVYDCLAERVAALDGADYRRWTLQQFSGTLCIDELHLGQKTLLLATDPINDFPVAFALVSRNDQDYMERFLRNLKNQGFEPGVVVTDGSNLYPTLLKLIWPAARHQLCVFHFVADLNAKVLDALRRLRRQLAARGGKGKPGKAKGAQGGARRGRLSPKEKAHFVFKHRHLIVTRRENLSGWQRGELERMLQYLPELRVLRQFVDRLGTLFEPGQSETQAWARRRALRREKAFTAVPELAEALESLSEEKFAKLIAFLKSPVGRQVRTNNHVERLNRQLRYLEKVRYKWRRRRSIVRFVLLAFDRWRQQHRRADVPPTAVDPQDASATTAKPRRRARPRPTTCRVQ